MNVERLRKLADHIEGLEHWPQCGGGLCPEVAKSERFKEKLVFSMNHYLTDFVNLDEDLGVTECMTAGCIAGHARQLFHREDHDELKKNYGIDSYSTFRSCITLVARHALGLSRQEADLLFHPGEVPGLPSQLQLREYDDVTPAIAARACRRMADGLTGAAIWND